MVCSCNCSKYYSCEQDWSFSAKADSLQKSTVLKLKNDFYGNTYIFGKDWLMTWKKFEKVRCRSRTWWNSSILWCIRTKTYWLFNFSIDWTVSYTQGGAPESHHWINASFKVSSDDKYTQCDTTSSTLWSFHLYGSFVVTRKSILWPNSVIFHATKVSTRLHLPPSRKTFEG